MRVPLFDAAREYRGLATELEAVALRVLASGRYVLGPEVEGFEREAAAYLGAGEGVGVGNGTDAIRLALEAAGIGPGDGVLTTPFTYMGTASAILAAGAVPVFADIDPETLTLDPKAAAAAMEEADPPVRAIVPVHVFGQPADMEALVDVARERGVAVIEDAAQAFGAEVEGQKVGSLGDAGCFSFFPTKNLGGFGDGGLVATDDPELAERVRRLRAHGATAPHRHETMGTNSRLDELQAALLRVRLRRIAEALAARGRVAEAYDRALAGSAVVPPARPSGRTPAFHLYVVRVPSGRDRFRGALAERGIETGVHYPMPLPLQESLRHLGYREGDLPAAEAACREVVSLPVYPSLAEEAEEIAGLVAAAVRG